MDGSIVLELVIALDMKKGWLLDKVRSVRRMAGGADGSLAQVAWLDWLCLLPYPARSAQ
ncbi:hypothetical protein [Bifidobacterium aquikefiri]|uniref:hypothetical protein n=1 Tax=Bifidobacterium aquikefiri TaxID=1653207 RepID=UPI0039E80694